MMRTKAFEGFQFAAAWMAVNPDDEDYVQSLK
jgi:hypothetical protein